MIRLEFTITGPAVVLTELSGRSSIQPIDPSVSERTRHFTLILLNSYNVLLFKNDSHNVHSMYLYNTNEKGSLPDTRENGRHTLSVYEANRTSPDPYLNPNGNPKPIRSYQPLFWASPLRLVHINSVCQPFSRKSGKLYWQHSRTGTEHSIPCLPPSWSFTINRQVRGREVGVFSDSSGAVGTRFRVYCRTGYV